MLDRDHGSPLGPSGTDLSDVLFEDTGSETYVPGYLKRARAMEDAADATATTQKRAGGCLWSLLGALAFLAFASMAGAQDRANLADQGRPGCIGDCPSGVRE